MVYYCFRDFLYWQPVRNEAAKMVEEMACNTPELRGMMHYPRGRNSLCHVVSNGYRYVIVSIKPARAQASSGELIICSL